MNDGFPPDLAAAGGRAVGCFGEFVLAGDVFVRDEVAHGGCVGSCLRDVSSALSDFDPGEGSYVFTFVGWHLEDVHAVLLVLFCEKVRCLRGRNMLISVW